MTKQLTLVGTSQRGRPHSWRLDDQTAPDLEHELDGVLDKPLKVLVFDLAGLEYTSSAGLRVFMRAQRTLNERAGKTVFVNVTPPSRLVVP